LNQRKADAVVLGMLPAEVRARSIDLHSVGVAEYAFPLRDVREAVAAAVRAGLHVFGGDTWSISPGERPKPIGLNWDAPAMDATTSVIDSLDQFIGQGFIDGKWYVSLVWSLKDDEDNSPIMNPANDDQN
jgi:hypothetical protein